MSRPTEPIPGPPPLPILGNLLDLDRSNTIKSFNDLGKKYGPLYKLRLAGSDRLFATGYEVIHELCSRKDFVKIPVGLVRSQKSLTPEGLFTADHGEECWDLAHRVLMPAFGPLSIKGMFAGEDSERLPPSYTRIALLMMLRNARLGLPAGPQVGALRRRVPH